jgi:exonuclease III
MLKLQHPTTDLTVMGVYGPSGGHKAEFLLELREKTLQHADENCLLMGDLNTTLEEQLDRKNYKTDNHRRCRTVINNWIQEGDYVDVFRAFYPDRESYTYRVQGNQIKRSTLDYALASRELFGKVTEIKHTHFSSSITDHAGVTVKSYWNTIRKDLAASGQVH